MRPIPRAQRFHIFNQLHHAILRNQTFEGRHNVVISGNDLRLRIEHRFPNIRLIRSDGRPVFQLDSRAEHTVQIRATPVLLVDRARMTGCASQLIKERLALLRHGAFAATLSEPGVEVVFVHHVNGSDHAGMLRPAILGAENVISADLRRTEPFSRVLARQHVGLGPERGHIEIVNHVFGRQRQPDIAIHRHMQLIDFPGALVVLDLPHPLLCP